MLKRIDIIFVFLIILLFITAFNSLFLLYYRDSNNICISLVIPSTYSAFNKCKNQVEYMVCKSLHFPKEVIIVISSSIFIKKEIYHTYCNLKLYLYYRKRKCNAASNKNFGSKYVTCSYISFFDIDDIMSKFRIKILQHIIKYYKYDIILHMYTTNLKLLLNNTVLINDISKNIYLNSSYITELYKSNIHSHIVQLWGCCHFLPKHYHISNGWITIKRSLFRNEKFNEDRSVQRAEDSEYNGRVIAKGYKALILTVVLGYYAKRNKCETIQNQQF